MASAAAAPPNKKLGKVKWFNSTKGYGFISPDDGGEDLFVHQTSIHSHGFRSLAEGEAVEFLVEEGDDGRPKAVEVSGPNGEPVQGDGGGRGAGGGYGAGVGRGRARGYGGDAGYGGSYGGESYGGGYRSAGSYGGGGGGGGRGSGACYTCGETGHLARDCGASSEGGGGRRSGGGGGGYGGAGYGGGPRAAGYGGGPRRSGNECFKCGENGHFARDCSIQA